MNNKYITLICCIVFGLSACAPNTINKPEPGFYDDIERPALSLMTQGEYDQAATEYLRLATTYPERTTVFRLKAAAAFFEAKDLQNTKLILNETVIDPSVYPRESLQKKIILARVAILEEEPDKAITLLDKLPENDIPLSMQVAFYESRSRAFHLLGLINESINERLTAYEISDASTEVNIDYEQLWSDLTSLELQPLEALKQTFQSRSISWIDLAIINNSHATNRVALENAIILWQKNYPAHVASENIIPKIYEESIAPLQPPEKVALILPLSGKFRNASSAIRDGFISSWLNSQGDKPEIEVYDSESADILQIYQQAIDEDADFIIGPLQKQKINSLLDSDIEFTIPTLLLNYLDEQPSFQNNLKKIYQFGLSPEQEAQQIATQSHSQGYKTALIIASGNTWGQRLAGSFKSKFEELGGQTLEVATFDSTEQNYDQILKSLLNTDISQRRAKQLIEVLRLNIKSETRPRQDADMIFMGANQTDAKLIIPHLFFNRANNIPVYATSSIHVFANDSEEYRDMNNIIFTDIPLLTDTSSFYDIEKSLLKQYWPNASMITYRLFSLGYDSYTIVHHFNELNSDPSYSITGTSGKLNMTETNSINRRLNWLKIKNNTPITLSDLNY